MGLIIITKNIIGHANVPYGHIVYAWKTERIILQCTTTTQCDACKLAAMAGLKTNTASPCNLWLKTYNVNYVQ